MSQALYNRLYYGSGGRRKMGGSGPGQYHKDEKKWFDTRQADAGGTTNADITRAAVPAIPSLVLIPGGSLPTQRIGNRCKIVSVQLRGTVAMKPVTTAAPSGNTTALGEAAANSQCRVVVVLDHQYNGAATPAAWTTVFQDPGYATPSTQGEITADFRNIDNVRRFTVLKDVTFNFREVASLGLADDATEIVATPRCVRIIDWYIKTNMTVEYNGATGAIGELCCNNVSVYCVNNNNRTLCEMLLLGRVRFFG